MGSGGAGEGKAVLVLGGGWGSHTNRKHRQEVGVASETSEMSSENSPAAAWV